jgi:type I restriction enzyme S subunit
MKSLMAEIKQFNEKGTVFGSISKSDFESIDVILPDLETIKIFQAKVKPIDDKVITNSIQIRTLTQLRDTLLPKLMSGEIRLDH